MKIAIIGTHIFLSEECRRRLEVLGVVRKIEASPARETITSNANDADILITWGFIDRALLDALKQLRCLVLLSTGYEECLGADVTEEYVRARGLTISYTPDCSTTALAEYALGAMIAARRLLLLPKDKLLSPLFSLTTNIASEFTNWKIGILGMGHVGTKLAELCHSLGMHVSYFTRDMTRPRTTDEFCVRKSLSQLASEVDVLAVTCALTVSSQGIINSAFLERAKKDVTLISIARGQVFNLKDLSQFMHKNEKATLIVDHLPSSIHSEALSQLPNVIVTPHLAFNTAEALENYTLRATECVEGFARHESVHVVPFLPTAPKGLQAQVL